MHNNQELGIVVRDPKYKVGFLTILYFQSQVYISTDMGSP